MRQSRTRQIDLFENIEHTKAPWPTKLNSEEIILLAQLMCSLVETIETEVSHELNEQD
jgi:hypothetical protein